MRFYGIHLNPFDEEDFGGMHLPEYTNLCYHLPAYDGALSIYLRKQAEERQKQEEIDNPKAARDESGRVKGISGTDWLKNRKSL